MIAGLKPYADACTCGTVAALVCSAAAPICACGVFISVEYIYICDAKSPQKYG